MDCLHTALDQALKELSAMEDARFVDAFGGFIAELEKSLRLEEAELEKRQCPSLLIHLEEHARALSVLHHLHSHVMAGGISEGREVVRDVLPQWLACHMASMDLTMLGSLEQTSTYGEPSPVFMEEASSNAAH